MAAADAHQVPAGSALAVDRDGFSAAVHGAPGSRTADHHRARRDRRPAAEGVGQRDRGHRPPHLGSAGRGDPGSRPAPTVSRSSTPSRRSSTPTASTSTPPGSSRATTSRVPVAPAPIT
ncbi:MAG: hypothetical protein ACMVO3_15250 [Thalassobaculum sp.]